MEEFWKDIEGFEGEYQISNLGRIKSKERVVTRVIKEKILKTVHGGNCGYEHVSLNGKKNKKDIMIHRELAKAFIPIPDELKDIPFDKLCVNHKDENKLNNSIDNLEWCTHKYNNEYGTARERGRETQIRTSKKKKVVVQLTLEGKFIKEFDSIRNAWRETGILDNNICECLKGRRKTAGGYVWKYKE